MHLRTLRIFAVVSFCAGISHALTFDEWREGRFDAGQFASATISGATADPDGDGAANLLEYVFSGDPLTADVQLMPKLEVVADTLALTYRERQGMTDVEIRLQGSDTLMNWITYNTVTEADREAFTGYDEVTLLDPVPFGPRRFLRLRVELLPVPALRAPTQLTIGLSTPTSWILGWTDPNTAETGYAIERQDLTTGAWERLATLGADTGGWTHTSANYQTGTTYRIIALGVDGTEAASDPVALADADGLLDAWEMAHFGNLNETDGGDYDDDGFTNLQEYENGTDPKVDYYHGVPPVIEAVSGRDQNYSPGEFLPKPLIVRVRNSAGAILAGAPVVFTASAEEGLLGKSNTDGAELKPSQTVLTDAQGLAQVWLKCP